MSLSSEADSLDRIKMYQREYRRRNRIRLNEKRRIYYQHNKTKLNHKRNIAMMRRYRQIRLEALRYYSRNTLKCACCDESHMEFLTIDHMNGDGNKQRKSGFEGWRFYQWLKKNGFPDGFRVLCMNCNHSLGVRGYCPHEKEKIVLVTR